MNLKAIGKSVLFTFVDDVNSKGQFETGPSEMGIIVQSTFDDSAKTPRWVKVTDVGEGVTTINAGDVVLLPALRWTAASKFEGRSIWKSDETQAAAKLTVDGSIQALNSYVVFKPSGPKAAASAAGIIVVASPTDTPSGATISVGPDCDQGLVDSTIYYDNTNFYETFEHEGLKLAFVKEESVMAYIPN